MSTFDFITDDTLRRVIERDKKEMDGCLNAELCKSVLLLAGSLVEAILVDFFMAFPPPNTTETKILRATLSELIDWAKEGNLISQRTFEISTVIRQYRNLIHPGKEYRLQERVDIHSAHVAAHLVEIIIEEVGENYSKKLGYTAEAAIAKIKIDPSCASIFTNMVEQMSPVERVKLFHIIPDVCLEKDNTEEMIDNFVRLHDLLAENVPSNIVVIETQKIKEVLNHKSREETLLYLRFFLKHLDLIDQSSQEMVIAYLLNLLISGDYDTLLAIRKIGPYTFGKFINTPKGRQKITQASRDRIWKDNDSETDEVFLQILEGLFVGLPDEYIKTLKKHLLQYQSSKAKYFVDRMNDFIPF